MPDLTPEALAEGEGTVWYVETEDGKPCHIHDDLGRANQMAELANRACGWKREIIPVVPQSALAASQGEVKRLREANYLARALSLAVEKYLAAMRAFEAAPTDFDLQDAVELRSIELGLAKRAFDATDTPPQRSEP